MFSLLSQLWDKIKWFSPSYSGSYLEYYIDTISNFFKTFRVGRFPEWKHEGWQLIGYFGELPDPRYPVELMLGWRTILIGFFKVKALPEDGEEIHGQHIKWSLVQGQIWLPFGRFGKM